MFLATKNSLCQYHAKQGFTAFVFFTFCSAVSWLVSHSIPDFMRFFELSLYGASIILYVMLLVWGIVVAARNLEKPIPIVGKRAANLPL